MGGDLDLYNSYAQRGNFPRIEDVVASDHFHVPGI